MTSEEYIRAYKSKDWKFNKIVPDEAFSNVNKIHPLKQKEVKAIVDEARNDKYVKRLIIFGSSTRWDCCPESDIDICIDWNEDCYDNDGVLKPFTVKFLRAISSITHGNADKVHYDYLDGMVVKDDVLERGVTVYEQNV